MDKSVFSEGYALTNSADWKRRQVLLNHLAMLILAVAGIAGYFGFDVPIDADAANQLSYALGGLVFAGNSVLTVITSKKIGFWRNDEN